MIFFKERFKEMRLRNGWNQKFVADALGVQESSVSNWESGENCPRPTRIPAIAQLFGCDYEYLAELEPGECPKRLTMEEAAERGLNVKGVYLPTGKAIEAFRQGLLREFILSDLDPVAKDKALKIIAQFRKNPEA